LKTIRSNYEGFGALVDGSVFMGFSDFGLEISMGHNFRQILSGLISKVKLELYKIILI
jgi:hypothetical protein